jgi:hypothetical protein
MRVQATAWAEAPGGRVGGAFRLALMAAIVVGVLGAGAACLSGIREAVLLSSPAVREAQARQSVAEAHYRTAELGRQTRSANAQAATEAAWQPWLTGAERVALIALLAAVPVGLVALLMGAVFLFRRHLSLPTSDGRVPLVGLDRDMAREALVHYQLRVLSRGASYEALSAEREPERVSTRRLELAPDEVDGARD